MNEIDLRRFDLNLLDRVRGLDDGAERQPRGGAAGTDAIGGQPLAVAVAQPVRRSLVDQGRRADAADRLRTRSDRTDTADAAGNPARAVAAAMSSIPRSSQRVFRSPRRISCSPLFAHLMSRLRSEAPGVSAEWTAPREPTPLDVAEGQIDVAIVPAELRLPDGVPARPSARWNGDASDGKNIRRFRNGVPTTWTNGRILSSALATI